MERANNTINEAKKYNCISTTLAFYTFQTSQMDNSFSSSVHIVLLSLKAVVVSAVVRW